MQISGSGGRVNFDQTVSVRGFFHTEKSKTFLFTALFDQYPDDHGAVISNILIFLSFLSEDKHNKNIYKYMKCERF